MMGNRPTTTREWVTSGDRSTERRKKSDEEEMESKDRNRREEDRDRGEEEAKGKLRGALLEKGSRGE